MDPIDRLIPKSAFLNRFLDDLSPENGLLAPVGGNQEKIGVDLRNAIPGRIDLLSIIGIKIRQILTFFGC